MDAGSFEWNVREPSMTFSPTEYINTLFVAEGDVLAHIRARHAAAGLPEIHVSPEEGRLLYVLLTAVGATRVLEVGSLGGYSGVWLARALPAGGSLTTVELDEQRAELAAQADSSTSRAPLSSPPL